MPINSTLDVVIQEDDLVVLGPPATVDISLDIGAQGDPGSQIYTGAFDPNSITISQFTTLYGAAPAARDVFMRTDIGSNYGTFYSYVSVPGGTQWEPVLEIIDAIDYFFDNLTDFILSASAGGTGLDNGTNTLAFDGNIDFTGGNDVTLTSTGTTSITLPVSGTVATLQNHLGQFANTTSAQLASKITDETGTGNLVFNTSPQLSTSLTTNSTSFNLLNTTATTVNFAGAAANLTIGADGAGTAVIRNSATTVSGDLTVGGSDIIATEATFNLVDTTATTVNFAGDATTVNIGATSGTTTVNNDLNVLGSLIVSGSVSYLQTEIIALDDNIILLNSNVTGTPTENAGIEVERGTLDNVSIRWNETLGLWEFTNDGTLYNALGSGEGGFLNHFLMMGA